MEKQPIWAVVVSSSRIDVVPDGHSHCTGSGSCWCGVRVDAGGKKPIVVHSLKSHDWQASGSATCRRCGVVQDLSNADDFCKGSIND